MFAQLLHVTSGVLLGAILLGRATPAEAHIGAHPPQASAIALHPDDPDLIAVRARSHGLAVSEDGGASWRMLCRGVVGTLASERIRLEYATDGALLLASFDGVQRGGSNACGWEFPDPILEKRVTGGLQRHPQSPSTFFVSTSQGGVMSQTNGLFRSDDDGRSWTRVGEDVEGFLSRPRIAPSDPERIYLTRVHTDFETDAVTYALRVSDDGGSTWVEHEFPLVEDEEETFGVLYVDPEDPDTVLAVVTSPDAHEISEDDTVDRIVRSEDAGQSWQDVFAPSDFGGLAAMPDGVTLWIGDTQGGLWRSDDRGVSFQPVHPELQPRERLHVYGLRYAHGALWIGGHYWLDGFSLGVSEDGGETVRSVMRWNEVDRLTTCPMLEVGSECSSQWHGWTTDILQDGYGPPRDLGTPPVWPPRAMTDAGVGADAGPSRDGSMARPPRDDAGSGAGLDAAFDAGVAGGDGPTEAGGCDCVVSGRASSSTAPWHAMAWVAVVMGVLLRRRATSRFPSPARVRQPQENSD